MAQALSPAGGTYSFAGTSFPTLAWVNPANFTVSASAAGTNTGTGGLFGGEVWISGAQVDINSHLSIGQPTDWTVTIGMGLYNSLEAYRNAHNTATICLVLNGTNTLDQTNCNNDKVPITATYDPILDRITLNRVSASSSGAFIRIAGQLMSSTPDGDIHVNGGLGNVQINNQTPMTIVVGDVYAGVKATADAASAYVDIVNTGNYDAAYNGETLYAYTPSGGITKYTQATSCNPNQIDPSSGYTLGNKGKDWIEYCMTHSWAGHALNSGAVSGVSTTYAVDPNQRWQWEETATLHRTVECTNSSDCASSWTASDWTWDMTNGGACPVHPSQVNPWCYETYQGTPWYGLSSKPVGTLVHDSSASSEPAFTEQLSVASVGYAGGWNIYYGGCDGGTPGSSHCNYGFTETNHNNDPWGGTSGYWGYRFPNSIVLQMTMSVYAGYGIRIDFDGNTTGTVDIESNNGGSVVLTGQITNPDGATTINTTGSLTVSQPVGGNPDALIAMPVGINTDTLWISSGTSGGGSIGTAGSPIPVVFHKAPRARRR